MKLWKESATILPLVLRSKQKSVKGIFNYDVLVQERFSKSSFFPGSYVFPGGIYEKSDASPEWIKYLCYGNKNNIGIFNQLKDWNLPIFQAQYLNENRQISLRICAIREIFEELGILICRPYNERPGSNYWTNPITNFDIKLWQERVHNSPDEFMTLCKELKCYPDVWSLYSWNNWLTPIGLYDARYDSAFFIIFLQSPPLILHDKSEVSNVLLLTPEQALTKYYKQEVHLPPPQLYEFLKLKNQHSIEDLGEYAFKQVSTQPDFMYSVICKTKDGRAALFPGDDCYPVNPDLNDTSNYFSAELKADLKDQTLEEWRNNTNAVHRFEFTDRYRLYIKNYTPKGLLPDQSIL